MMTGEPMTTDDWGSANERKEARRKWSLPAGFVSIAPPVGHSTIPRTPTLNPGGLTMFDAELLRESAFAEFADGYLMNGFRSQLTRSLDLLASTDQAHVFAHLLAPHTPFLYTADGTPTPAPKCWPDCHTFEIRARYLDMTVDEWAIGVDGYLRWLNWELVEVIDSILEKRPNADIVLFSDHGGRFDETNQAEWHRSFLAAHTPDRTRLFASSPHPGSILEQMTRKKYPDATGIASVPVDYLVTEFERTKSFVFRNVSVSSDHRPSGATKP